MLTIVAFKWRSDYKIAYTAQHVNVLAAMLARQLTQPFRFVCITDDPEGVEAETFPLWGDCATLRNASGRQLPSCYRRLKLFDPATQAALGVPPGERLVSIDLDTVLCGPLDPLFDRPEPFVGWAVAGTHRPRVFNGSLWMLRGGAEAHVWRDFDPATSPRTAAAAGYLGSDQAWMSLQLPGRAGWGEADGVLSFPRALRAGPLPETARAVMFHGFQKPWMERLPTWVAQHYRMNGRGRALILGYGPSVWSEALAALRCGFDGVIASPEAAEHWPGPVDAIGHNDGECERLAALLGFDETVFCGRSEEVREAA